MNDLYLKFPDEATAHAALFNEDGQPLYQMAIDIIGVISKPTGNLLPDGAPEMTTVDGFHVNTRGEAPEELMPYVITSNQPVRVWA